MPALVIPRLTLYFVFILPYPDELLEETVEELGVTQHPQGVARGCRVDNDAVELDAQLVVPLHQPQNLPTITRLFCSAIYWSGTWAILIVCIGRTETDKSPCC